MQPNIATALSAYADAAARGTGTGMPVREPAGPSFGDLVRQSITDSIEVGRESERVSVEAAVGRADLTDVVTAVGNAEVTLQTVVAVRDKVITAYQEILRMPI